MLCGAIRTSLLGLTAIVAMAGAASAQSADWPAAKMLTISLDATLGPVLSGSDPAGLNGESATVTVTASEGLKPYKTTGSSSSYHLPAGAIVVDVNGTDYQSTSRSTMTIKLGTKADVLSFKSSLEIEGLKVNVTDTTSLASGSWSKKALQHPMLFAPSPQTLTSPSSHFQYDVFGEATDLGVSGTASNSDAAEAELVARAAP